MEQPLQIAFHNTPPSRAVEDKIRELVAVLESTYDRIISCHVVVDVPHRHHKEGNQFQVRLNLHLPGGEVVVRCDPSDQLARGDLNAILLDAFEDTRRQLEDHVRRLRGHVKAHEPTGRARVASVFPDLGFGFLETPEGREVYFHQHSVVNGDFSRIEPGVTVAFVEELGIKGPQASTVRPLGRHHHPH